MEYCVDSASWTWSNVNACFLLELDVGATAGDEKIIRDWARFPSGEEVDFEEDPAKMQMFELYH